MVIICDGRWDEDLERSNAEALNNTGGGQRSKIRSIGAPETTCGAENIAESINWTFSDDHRSSIAEKSEKANCNDETTVGTGNKLGNSTIELNRKRHCGRRNQRTQGANVSCAQDPGDGDKTFLPRRPIVWIVRIIRWLTLVLRRSG